MTWYVLGFTPDDVVMAWQDSRLARECVHAWQAEGRPDGFRVLQTAGEGDHLVYWFVCEDAAKILDGHGVDWRRFLVGTRPLAPPDARDVLTETA